MGSSEPMKKKAMVRRQHSLHNSDDSITTSTEIQGAGEIIRPKAAENKDKHMHATHAMSIKPDGHLEHPEKPPPPPGASEHAAGETDPEDAVEKDDDDSEPDQASSESAAEGTAPEHALEKDDRDDSEPDQASSDAEEKDDHDDPEPDQASHKSALPTTPQQSAPQRQRDPHNSTGFSSPTSAGTDHGAMDDEWDEQEDNRDDGDASPTMAMTRKSNES